jgi:hypothetical protein
MQKRYVRKMVFVGGKYRGWGFTNVGCWVTPHWMRLNNGDIFVCDDEDVNHWEYHFNNSVYN